MTKLEKLMMITLLGCGFHAFIQGELELFVASVLCYFVSKFVVKELKEDHTRRV